LTCEERERGLLLAQALSPASPGEILAAKSLLYPAVAVGLAGVLAAEARAQGRAARTHDYAEGITAFQEKRKPSFTGD
jgi:enoyl-CoA hydratase/carnithine racemase